MAVGTIRVVTGGQSITVNVTRSGGGASNGFLDRGLTSPASFPAVITSDTSFYFNVPDSLVISALIDGLECAVQGGSTDAVYLDADRVHVIAPSISYGQQSSLDVGFLTQTSAKSTYVAGLLPAPSGTDDTAAITAAITAAAAGATLVAAPGASYIVSSLALNKRLTLDMTGATITQKAASTGDLLVLSVPGSTVRGGTWDGNSVNQTNAQNRGITVTADNCAVLDTTVQNTKFMGIYGNGCNRARILRNTVTNTGYISIFVQTNGASIFDNVIEGNWVDRSMIAASSISEGGLKVHGASSAVIAGRTRVNDNRVTMPTSPTDGTAICVELTYCYNGQAARNHTLNGAMGMSIAASDKTVVQGNVVFGPSGYGIEIAGSKFCSVSGNTLDGNALGTIGIQLDQGNGLNSDRTSISGNTVQGFVTSTVNIQTAIRCSVTGNTLSQSAANYILNASQADGLNVSGNSFDGFTTAQKAIFLNTMSNCTISGNQIMNTSQNAITLYAASAYTVGFVSIAGNTFYGTAGGVALQLSGGATANQYIKCSGNIGQGDYDDFNGQITHTYGTGSPLNVVYGAVGSTYYRTDGGAATTFYVKESGGVNTNTGWVGK